MANFKTHLAVGVISSGMLSTVTIASGMVPPNELVALALVGAFGSVLPDIDLQSSRASQAIFNGIGLFLAFSVVFRYSDRLSIAEMWILWVGTFVTVRYVGHSCFHAFARHRGIWHSILAAMFFACLTSAIFYHLFNVNSTSAWLAGTFMFFGYIVHLLLDELYSVDFHGDRVKRSFGTALKIFDGKSLPATLGMCASLIAAFYFSPPIATFATVVTSPEVYTDLNKRLLPENGWFGIKRPIIDLANANNTMPTAAIEPNAIEQDTLESAPAQ